MSSGAVSGEPGPPPAEPDEPDDVLEYAGSRWLTRLMNAPRPNHSRWRRALGVGIALAVGLTVGLSVHGSTNQNHANQPSQKSASHDVAQISIPAVRALALHHGPLVSYVRQSSPAYACAQVAVGRSPRRAIATAIQKAFPQFAFSDSATTLDQFTGLCAIEVRATRPGAVIVVSVASRVAYRARASYTRLETGIESDGQVTTKYAFALTRAGWQIIVGAIGSTARLPSAGDLLSFAQDPSLTW